MCVDVLYRSTAWRISSADAASWICGRGFEALKAVCRSLKSKRRRESGGDRPRAVTASSKGERERERTAQLNKSDESTVAEPNCDEAQGALGYTLCERCLVTIEELDVALEEQVAQSHGDDPRQLLWLDLNRCNLREPRDCLNV